MRVLYYLILIPLSLLPTWILYRISDAMYLVLYRMIGYRRGVIRTNIENSFPEHSQKKNRSIEQQFYMHLCDIIMESVKAFTISKEELDKRMMHRNPELLQKYFDQGQHITLVGGHSGNWEFFAVSVALHTPHQPIALFTPMTNKFMNNKIKNSRSKFGLWMNSYTEVKEIINGECEKPLAVIFGADQCPNLKQTPHWTTFLNQETGVQFGTEKFARDNNTPVVYGFIHRVKRGHYEMEYKLVCENPNDLPIGEISEEHTRLLEEDIRTEPAFWLWTHKRWKRTRIEFENRQAQLEIEKLSA